MKEQKDSSFALTVTHPDAVRVLLDRTQAQLLRPFFKGETTVSKAAERLEVRLQFLFRKVQHLTDVGLLVVSREEARKGRALRLYRTPAPRFFIPAAAVDMETLLRRSEELWNRRLTEGLVRAWSLRTDEGLGVQVGPNTLRGVRIELTTAPERPDPEAEPVMHHAWLRLGLSEADARAFAWEMAALGERYTAKHQGGTPRPTSRTWRSRRLWKGEGRERVGCGERLEVSLGVRKRSYSRRSRKAVKRTSAV